MTLQDLTNNREMVVCKIRYQITMATLDNIAGVMRKMVAMLPQFANEKPTKGNVSKLAMKAISSYIKYDLVSTAAQSDAIAFALEIKKKSINPFIPSILIL